METQTASEEVWPKIATTELKHQCLSGFKKALSNNVVHQTVCMVCACFHYKLESVAINIGKIPNQHFLYPVDEMPCCIIRLNIDIDPNSEHVEMSG